LKIWRNLSKILAKLVEIYSRKKKSQLIYLSKNSKILPWEKKKKKKSGMIQRKRCKGVQCFSFPPSLSNCTEEIFFEIGIPPTQSHSLHATTQLLCFFTKGLNGVMAFSRFQWLFLCCVFTLSFCYSQNHFGTITPSLPPNPT
jgi:hypothetical protein